MKSDIEEERNEAAVASARPQLLAIRGGSLGFIPPANHAGLLAGVDAKIVGGGSLSTSSSVDAFAKVGGIHIGSFLTAEVIGESFEADVPLITLTGMPAVPGMVKTGFSSVGIRGRFNTRPVVLGVAAVGPEMRGSRNQRRSQECQSCQYPE